MLSREVLRYAALAALGAALAACAAPHARREAAPKVVKTADRAFVDRLFARAVFAYRRGEYRDAGWYVHDILELDPRHADALALRARLQALNRLP